MMRRCWPWCVVMLLAAGCSSVLAPRPDRSRFFVLTSMQDPANPGSAAPHSSNLSIGLGPVKFPAYLDRREVVTRSAPNRLELSDTDRWAEPLEKNFTRVLAEDLSAMLGTREMMTFPWFRSANLDYQVRAEVSRFETDGSGNAQLTATWEIKDPAAGAVLYAGHSDVTESSQSADSAAAALSRAVEAMSRQIADAIQAVRAAHPPDPPKADSHREP